MICDETDVDNDEEDEVFETDSNPQRKFIGKFIVLDNHAATQCNGITLYLIKVSTLWKWKSKMWLTSNINKKPKVRLLIWWEWRVKVRSIEIPLILLILQW